MVSRFHNTCQHKNNIFCTFKYLSSFILWTALLSPLFLYQPIIGSRLDQSQRYTNVSEI